MLELTVDPLAAVVLIGLLITAVVSDLASRRIPNQLIIVGLLIGMTGQLAFTGIAGLFAAAGGTAVGLACLLPFYIRGAMGAGDVKLMAMCGAFLGPLQVVVAAVASLLMGGVIGVAWFFWQYLSKSDDELPADVARYASPAASAVGQRSVSPVPYALAIFAGVLLIVTTPALAEIVWGKGVN